MGRFTYCYYGVTGKYLSMFLVCKVRKFTEISVNNTEMMM